jgi:4'-phosphopantetheinyl transferase
VLGLSSRNRRKFNSQWVSAGPRLKIVFVPEIEPLAITCWENFSQSRLTLDRNLVHLWCAAINPSASIVRDLGLTLSEEEWERAERFKFPKDQRRFIVGRGLLRRLLASYLSCEPGAVEFTYGASGKPGLTGKLGCDLLSFNLSHAGSLVMFAFARGRQLGVDIEGVDAGVDIDPIVNQFFTPGEIADVNSRPADLRHHRFFELWTRKEALAKAQGKGLFTALRELDTSAFDSDEGVIQDPELNHLVRSWWLSQLAPAPGYVAALAANKGSFRIACREMRWTELSNSEPGPSLRAVW